MFRLIVFLIAVALVAAGLSWLADRPGELVVQWQGYQVETSVFRAIIIFAVLFIAALLAWSVFRHVWYSPASVSNFLTRRRQKRGLEALSSGMIALGTGDRAAATRSAIQARKSLPNEPLTHLLRAHAAQLAGDPTTARRIFEAMLASPDTEQLGLRGLYLEAQRVGETEAARHFSGRAVALNPKLDWAVDALFDLQCRLGDWAGALDTLAIARKQGHIERAKADRRRAVLLTAQAQAAEEDDPNRALHLAVEANGLAADLVPAATIAGRLLAARGNTPRATKILQKTWSRSPHPALATTYAFARIGDSPRDRLDRVKQLAALTPNSVEGPIAVATAAIEAHQFDDARDALKRLLDGRMTQRVATLMARIEGEEHGDKGRVREWLARAVNASRDPAWTADGVVAEHWSPVSPVTGTLDAFRWRVPVEPIDKREGEVLASKLEELVTLGAPRESVVPGKNVPAKAAPADVPETIEVAPVPAAETTAKENAEPTPLAAEGTAVSTPDSRENGENQVATKPRRKVRKEPSRTDEPRVYTAPHAPDDPGPETGDQDDIGPPLRPQRA
ncbi:MAG: heme biosynthesis protein HemY [Hyphomicrobium sp.]